MRPQARTAGAPWRLQARRAAIPLCIAACFVLLFSAAFSPVARPLPQHLAAWALLCGSLLAAAVRAVRFKLQRRDRPLPAAWAAETALLCIAGAQALEQLTGGPAGPLAPLGYLLAAGLTLALPVRLSIPLLAALLLVDAGAFLAGDLLPEHLFTLLAQALFTGLFAALYHAVLAARLRQAQAAEESAVQRRVAEAEERARELRLVVTADPLASTGGDEARERQLLSAVHELEEGLRAGLSVAEVALRPHTVALLLASPEGGTLQLREAFSRSERLQRGPIPAGAGALGAVLSTRAPLRQGGSKDKPPHLTWYDGPPEVQSFLGVPLFEPALPGQQAGPEPLGVLGADREAPFTEDEELLLVALSASLSRAIASERLLSAVREEKDQRSRFFRALEGLNKTRTAAEAASVTLEHARRLCPSLDLCALTLREGGPDAALSLPPPPKAGSKASRGAGSQRRLKAQRPLVHRVAAVWGEGSQPLAGLSFNDNAGLVASVVKLGTELPGRDAEAMDKLVVFDPRTQLRGLSALRIFPLQAGGEVIGTLVCGSRRRGGIPPAARADLGMLALQAAEALVRARLFEQAERLATTDGLTGLYNRRSLDTELRARFAEAQRYRRALSFVLLDVDHFKKVNDVHGHPAGDAVLKGVAAIVAAQARDTDRAARYGGEEMALLLPETEPAGARVIAERLRQAIEEASHETESGGLRVTVSLGVSSIPAAGIETPEQLLEAADQALYRAKQGGRNRVEQAPARS
jgi:two-component system, cell cycle response regulator